MRTGTRRDIVPGEPLAHSIHDPSGKLLLSRGMVIATAQQVERLVERGFQVDEGPAEASRRPSIALPSVAARAPDAPVFDAVRDIADALLGLHRQLLAQATSGFPEAVLSLAGRVEQLARRDVDAALASMHLLRASDDDAHAARFVHGAVLVHVVGSALGMAPDERRSTLAAALTYDVALLPVARVLNHQSAPLSDDQRRVVNEHPQVTHDLLLQAGVGDSAWLRAVLEHHERVDGTGYPRGLAGDAISLPGRLIGIVDTFSAMIRPRAYRQAVLCRHALRDIFLARSRSVDERMAHAFVREVGMYPPGSLVKLASREVAVVVRRGPDATHPDVRVVMDANSGRTLSHPPRDTRLPETQIVEGIPQHRYPALQPGIHRLWRQA